MSEVVFSVEEKKELLKRHDWEVQQGYLFPSADEGEFTFLPKSEVDEILKEGVNEYWFSDLYSEALSLDEAWDYFFDDLYPTEGDLSDDEVVARLRAELDAIKKEEVQK